jgi:hypothetical protein
MNRYESSLARPLGGKYVPELLEATEKMFGKRASVKISRRVMPELLEAGKEISVRTSVKTLGG